MSAKIKDSLVVDYFRSTSFSRKTIRSVSRPDYADAEAFKSYPDSKKILLPRIGWKLAEARILQLLQQRRSIRSFPRTHISLADLAFMLWGAQGITAQAGAHLFRTAPSAGALYPVETYVVVQNVEDLKKGIYHFDVRTFQLELIDDGDYSRQVAAAFLDQEFMTEAAINVIWTAGLQSHHVKIRGARRKVSAARCSSHLSEHDPGSGGGQLRGLPHCRLLR